MLLVNSQPLPHDVILRTIATARIVMPTTIIRLAAGRQSYSEAQQVLCFMAGANAIFTGDAMLTTPCECTLYPPPNACFELKLDHSTPLLFHFFF